MAEESGSQFTQQDVNNATRLAAVEVHVHNIKESISRLETAQSVQAAVNASMSESIKKTELMVVQITTQLSGLQPKLNELSVMNTTVITWKGAIAVLVFILGSVIAVMIKEWVIAKP